MKLFHEDNSRLRYLTREEYGRLIEAVRAMKARANKPSPYLEEKIVLAAHTGLRRGSLFDLQWDQIDLANSVMRIPRTKSGRPLSVPLNATAKGTLEKLSKSREPENPYVFPHKLGKNAGEPVHDVKNGFHAALELAGIEDFTWHDLRHTFASWLMMRGASLRSVAELLGHQSIKMTMRYAHLSPTFLSAEVSLLDPPPPPAPTTPKGKAKSKRARKGRSGPVSDSAETDVSDFIRKMAPQAGFEPATLRLTATFLKPAGDDPGQPGRFSLGNPRPRGNSGPHQTAPDCPQFVPRVSIAHCGFSEPVDCDGDGWNPLGLFGFCNLQIPHCRECRRCPALPWRLARYCTHSRASTSWKAR